ncbi:MAG TPA: ATP-binding cassette domain-containing protein [Planctomycetota bacterium]|nr:ATP-binding cassette domain-containing protein [Planctomycetota bacterium]
MITLERVSATGLSQTAPLHEVDLRLDPGEFTLVTGRRGAGKSTLMRLVNGLIDPTEGAVRVEHGRDLRDRRVLRRHLRRTAMILSAPPAYGSASVLARLLGTAGGDEAPSESEAFGVLRRVELLGRAHVAMRDLSAVELRRFSIARALLGRPQWILAYEPVETLDMASVRSTLELLRRVSREDGTGVLASLTRTDLIADSADRILLLESGRLVWDSSAGLALPGWKEGRMEINYCSGCGIRLERRDFIRGGAGILDHRPYCGECLRRNPALRAPERTRSPRRRVPLPR